MKSLDLTQTEQLKQIADYLYQQRQEKNIPLEKVAKDTFIPLRLLQALESSHFERLPEPVYIKGFIRRYADVLGLDGMDVARAFQVEPAALAQPAELKPVAPRAAVSQLDSPQLNSPQSQPLRSQPTQPEPKQAEHPHPEPSRPDRSRLGASRLQADRSEVVHPEIQPFEPLQPLPPEPQPIAQSNGRSVQPSPYPPTTPPSSSRSSYLPWIGVGLAVGTLAAIAVAVLNPSVFNPSAGSSNGSDQSPSTTGGTTPSNTESPTAGTSSPTPSDSASPSPSASPAADAPVQVSVNLTGDSWMQVVADGKVEYEGTLPKGEQRLWKAKKSLVVSAGNAGAVLASYNQGEAKPMGKLGDVVEVAYPKP
jgi:cytoskeleton protein RodZ